MKKRLLPAWASCLALAMASYVFAGDADENDPLPDPDILKSAIIIDCGQWPIENDEELAPRFRSDCQSNSKLMGYAQAWTLIGENVPQEAFDHPHSFNCGAVQPENIGYFCVGIREN